MPSEQVLHPPEAAAGEDRLLDSFVHRVLPEFAASTVASSLASVEAQLMAWHRKNGRDLPWRRTRDPYAILVSEVMLQQTRICFR
jgi:hypothetical protein